jgi:RHS repeat-associated protein
MRTIVRLMMAWLLCCVVVLIGSSTIAFGEGSLSAGGSSASSPLEGPLVVPGGPEEGQQARAAEEAKRDSPEAVAAREESRTEYQGLDSGQAAKVVGEAFPNVINEPAGGPPQLPAGQTITGYPSNNAAQVDLGGGRRGVIDSLQPIAMEASPGKRVPLNLALTEQNGGFAPFAALVDVRIPKHLAEGVSLTESGVSLTPVDGQGAPLSGSEGSVDGSSVLFADALTDADVIAKPTTQGVEEGTILRSIRSPSQLSYRLGIPQGAGLVQSSDGTDAVKVIENGIVIATVAPPIATDATGMNVPVAMTVSGDTLTLAVNTSSAPVQYPVYVDPTITDKEISFEPGTWLYYTDDSEIFDGEGGAGSLADRNDFSTGNYFAGDWGFFSYTTQGASRIYAFVATARELHKNDAPVADQFELRTGAGKVENGNGSGGKAEITEPIVNSEVEHIGVAVCAESACGPVAVAGSEQNAAYFEAKALGEGEAPRQSFYMELEASSIEINQEAAPTASFDVTDPTVEGLPNALLSGKWYKPTSNAKFGINAVDTGIGVYKQGLSSPSKAGWGYTVKTEARNECRGVQCNQCFEPACAGKRSGNGQPLTYSLTGAAGGELPEGEDTVEGKIEDDVGLSVKPTAKIKIDNASPHNFTFTGLPGNHEISDGQHYVLKASAVDGSEGTKSSGVASIVLQLDGQQIGGPQGSCSPGPCTGTAEWTLSGENYAAGQHTLSVIATDNAGNAKTEEYQVIIHHPENVAAGPGSVNPVTGEFSLSATDVSLSVPDGALTVNRSYGSRHLAQGTEGPLGPQWNLSLGAEQSLSRIPGGMVLIGSTGGQVVFVSKSKGEFGSPTGDAGLILLEKTVEGKTVFTLSENGSVTTFELPSGSSGGVWMPSSSEGPNGTSATLYKFKLEAGVIEPKEELAPVPAGVSCGKEISELKAGCRALKFEYAKETKATGENASQWGEFTGHLSEVKYIAWNASKAKTEATVAQYAYDKQGRLRAEWDPRVTPSPLKTTYGYDAEGHVTALNAPGKQPWLFEQGTTSSDASAGRLMAISLPAASTAFGAGEAPTITSEVPTLSSTKPAVGTKISVSSNGKWTGSPLAYSYQWQDCNSAGKECTAIAGAINQSYYPVSGDEGHTLAAQVVALNATGATTASSATTSTVAAGTPNTPLPEPPSVGTNSVWTLEYQVPVTGSSAPHEMSSTEVSKWGQTDDPAEAMAIFPPDKVMGWPAKEYKRETVYYIDGKDRAVNTASSTGGISTAEYNPYNDITRTLSPDNRATAIAAGESKSKELSKELDTENSYNETGSEPGTELLSTLGPKHNIELTNGTQAEAREHKVYSYNEGAPSEGGPYHLVTTLAEGAQIAGKEEAESVRTTKTSYSGQSNLGWKLRKPTSVITDPTGLDLIHTTEYEATTGNIIQTKTPAASGKDARVPPSYSFQFGSKGTAGGQFGGGTSDAIDAHGNVWVTDWANNRVEEFSSSGTFIETIGFGVSNGEAKFETCTSSCKAGVAGSGAGQFSGPIGIAVASGYVYVADYVNDRVEKFTEKGEYVASIGSKGKGAGQLEAPISVAVNPAGDLWVGDINNDRVSEFTAAGTFVETLGFGVSNGEAKLEVCTSSCKAGLEGDGTGQFAAVEGLTFAGSNLYVVDYTNNRIVEFNEKAEYVTEFGTKGTGNGQLDGPDGIATNPVSGDLYVTDLENYRVQVFTPSGSYLTQFGVKGSGNGQLNDPENIAINSSGDAYLADSANYRVEEWIPTVTGNEGTHNTKTIYYSSAASSEYKECGEKPELANLPCEVKPAAQPETTGLPELPITKSTYNIWGEPEKTTETVGTTARTKTETYDGAGRLKTSAISSTVGTALPTVTYEYNKENGALEKQCTNEGKPCSEGKPKTITTVLNTLGETTSYTDADENASTYEYDIDGRVKKTNTGKGTETYTYSATTGLPTELLNEYSPTKLKFTGTYDPEGNLLTEGYPNGMTATYTYNQVAKPTALVYKKMTNCTEEEKEKCKWFKDAVIPSIHGQWLLQTSTLSKQEYTYDQAGRLTKTQNTPAGKSCTTRIYAYDEDTNRTSLTTREPNAKGECATEGGSVEGHTYDTADRLTDSGTTYSTFGNITSLPAVDAGGKEASENLTSTYYADNQLNTEKQKEQTIGYNLDPSGRTRETVATGAPMVSDIISHYAGPGNAPSWTVNSTSGETTRDIPGLGGGLAAVQNNAEAPELQLANLHGDIIAKAYTSETATELASKADTGEFGVPTTSLPSKYSWLGASEIPTELPSGVLNLGARSYVPQIGRFLQPDPVPGGSADAYTYTFGDPVDSSDPSGEYTAKASAATLLALKGEEIAVRGKGERQRGEREAAEKYAAELAARAAEEAAAAAGAAAGPQYGGEGEEEWEEWEEEEEEYEYAAYHPHAENGTLKEAHVEGGLLYQPLGEAVGTDEGNSSEDSTPGSTVPLCKADVQGSCARSVRGGEGTCKPCRRPGHNRGGGGNGTETACAALGILDFIPGVLESPPGFVGTAYCAGYSAGRVASGR